MDDPSNNIQFHRKRYIGIIYSFFFLKVFLHALGQIIRITIEDRVVEGFTKYSKRIRNKYSYGQGVPEPRASEF